MSYFLNIKFYILYLQTGIFEKEYLLYGVILPILSRERKDKGLKKLPIPQCFYAHLDPGVLVMINLKEMERINLLKEDILAVMHEKIILGNIDNAIYIAKDYINHQAAEKVSKFKQKSLQIFKKHFFDYSKATDSKEGYQTKLLYMEIPDKITLCLGMKTILQKKLFCWTFKERE